MPGKYSDAEWDAPDEAKQQLEQQLNGAHFAGLSEPQNADDVRRMQDEMGKDNLIAWLSGTTDKRSRQWKSARDGLSRRRSGRQGIGKLWRNKFQTASRRSRTSGLRAGGSLTVTITADIKVSSKWDRQRPMYARLTGEALESYLEALEAGDTMEAAMVVAEEYGIPPEEITAIENVSGYNYSGPADDE